MTTYWSNLTQAERDELLITIPFVENPERFDGFLQVHVCNKNLLNYSQIYSACRRCLELPNPKDMRTGDYVQNGEYRGVGMYYVIWLRKGLISHSDKFITKFKKDLVECAEEDLKPDVPESYRSLRKSKRSETFPKYVSRFTNGPHNDGDHDCYLSLHPDEMGYAASIAMSSVPLGYYDHSEFDKAVFDPLLTHSKSHWGKQLAKSKKTEKFANDDSFPFNCIGFFDSNLGEDEELEYVDIEETKGDSGYCPFNYIPELRDLFNRHFDPTAPKAVFDKLPEDHWRNELDEDEDMADWVQKQKKKKNDDKLTTADVRDN